MMQKATTQQTKAALFMETSSKDPWRPLLDPSFPLRMPCLKSIGAKDLADTLWQRLQDNGKEGFFTFWKSHNVDMAAEFQKKDLGLFRAILDASLRTLSQWRRDLETTQVLRVYGVPQKGKDYPLDPGVHQGLALYPVVYADKPWLTLYDLVPHMIGRHQKSLGHWFEDIFLTMPMELSHEKEMRAFLGPIRPPFLGPPVNTHTKSRK